MKLRVFLTMCKRIAQDRALTRDGRTIQVRWIAVASLLAVGVINGIGMAQLPKAEVPKPTDGKLWAAISHRGVYNPDTISFDRRTLHLALVNDSGGAVETGAGESVLVVNGKPVESRDWLRASVPGSRIGGWDNLPAGDTTGIVLDMERFATEPGIYRVSWKGKAFETSEIVFRILPQRQPPWRGKIGLPNPTAGNPVVVGGRHPYLVPEPIGLPVAESPKAVPGKLWAVAYTLKPVFEAGERLHFGIDVVNDGDRAIAPGIGPGGGNSYLVINDVPLQNDAWQMFMLNGLGSSYSDQLPPGEHTGRTLSAERFFPDPGVYRVSWRGQAFESPEVVFRVLPRKQK
jgi:hypothetical protein